MFERPQIMNLKENCCRLWMQVEVVLCDMTTGTEDWAAEHSSEAVQSTELTEPPSAI